MKKRLALVFSQTPSEWVSCQSITSNLRKTYEQAFSDWELASFDLSPNRPQLHIWQSAQQIAQFRPHALSLIDHKPHPRKLLQTMAHLPPLYIHLFGDYALYAKEWQLCQELMGQTPTCLITASERQRRFVSQFFIEAEKNFEVFPFPVDSTHFNFNSQLRAQGRRRLGLSPTEKAIVFTGRLSVQKNILLLIQEVHHARKELGQQIRLYLAGPMDDLGQPYFGIEFLDGHYFHLLHQFLQTTEEDFRQRVHFLGPQGPQDLLETLCASDVFVSLGQHNDEDYGMSPAEAVCTGLPTLLTDWGGYTSFAKGQQVELLPLSWGKGHFEIDHALFVRKLKGLLELDPDEQKRKQMAQFYQDHFSIHKLAPRLREIFSSVRPTIKGLHPKNEVFSAIISREAPFYFGGQEHAYYREVYSPYWQQ